MHGFFIDLQKAFDAVDCNKKAFDAVDCNILRVKIFNYDVRDTADHLFCSYLTNRKQYVLMNLILILMSSTAESLKVLYWLHFYSWSTSITYIRSAIKFSSPFLLT